MKCIDEGLDKLRFLKISRHEPSDLWRGLKDIIIPERFLSGGGADIAPMSTSKSLQVALRYAFRGNSATLFRIRTRSHLERGVDISWLSCFPAEGEYLYRPITSLVPIKDEETKKVKKYEFDVGGKAITILEVLSIK